MAEASIPAGFELESAPQSAQTSQAPIQDEEPIPAGFETAEEHYGSPMEKLKTFVEGMGQGLVGPLAPMAERAMGVNPADISGRPEANPYISGAGKFVSLVAPLVYSGGASAAARAAVESGEAATEATGVLAKVADYGTVGGLMDTVGNLATKAVGLGNLSKDAGYAAKVGSSIVRNAAEMAIMQSSDEASRIAASDDASQLSVEQAIGNVGAATAFGGLTGGVITGAVSPLWRATGLKVWEDFMHGMKWHIDADRNIIHNPSGVSVRGADEPSIAQMGYDPRIRNVTQQYLDSIGRQMPELPELTVDPARGAALAKVYDAMEHTPNELETRKAYTKMIGETQDMWNVMKQSGLKVDPIAPDMPNPYKRSTDMINDVRQNNHMWFYPTSSGFGANARKIIDDGLPRNFSMISAQVGKQLDPAKHSAMRAELEKLGFKVSDALGNYGGTKEPSFMVEHDGSKTAKEVLDQIGREYGQESVLHSTALPDARWNHLSFMDGKPAQHGFGSMKSSNLKTNFTDHPEYGKFSLDFKPTADNHEHPLLGYTNEIIGDRPLQHNDIFHMVHDYFGHAKEGFPFGPKGEENAWHHHMHMYSPEARKAMTSETRGQNSVVNFGKNGSHNRANPQQTIYAEQKAGIMPAWTRDTSRREISTYKAPIRALTRTAKEAIESTPDIARNAIFESSDDSDSLGNKLSKALGINISPIMKAAVSGEPRAVRWFHDLNEIQDPTIRQELKDYTERLHGGAVRALGADIQDFAHYDEAELGNNARQTFLGEFKQKYAPAIKQMEERDRLHAGLELPLESRQALQSQILQKGMEDVRADSPYYKIYQDYATRVASGERNDVAGMDMLATELFNRGKSFEDANAKNAYYSIRGLVKNFVNDEMTKQDLLIGKEGAMNAAEWLTQRKAANEAYTGVSKMTGDLFDHLGMNWQRGMGSAMAKINDLSPEEFMKKFSPKGNAEFIPFLQKHFPETLKEMQAAEQKKFIAPSIYREGGEMKLDINHLNKRLNKLYQGQPQYANFVMPKNAQQAIQTAQEGLDAIPKIKSSGTGGWIHRLMQHPVASAISTIGYLSGHNPILSYLLSEAATHVGRTAPAAAKLTYLKWLGSDKPVNAAAFKQMSTLFDNSIRMSRAINKGSESIFQPGVKVAQSRLVADNRDQRDKLDNTVTKYQENPQQVMTKMMRTEVGHYLPAHQQSIAAATTSQLQYLAALKPQSVSTGLLGKEIPPSPMQIDRYHSALDIANNPLSVLDKVKSGTIQPSDIQDLKALYPAMTQQLQTKIMDQLTTVKTHEIAVPYKTKIGLSLFLNTPVDSALAPQGILDAQKTFLKSASPQQNSMGSPKRGTSTLGKSNKTYRTLPQAAEQDRNNRE